MSDPKQFHIYGDLNVSAGLDASLGEGSVFISSQSSVLDVNGSTFLDQTTIDTTDGAFAVAGTNKIAFTPTNAAIELQGGATSYFNVTTGNLTLGSLLQDVIINTGNGFDVNADTSITLDSNANSYFNVNGGSNLTLGAVSGRVIINPGAAVSNALTLSATNTAGGVVISAGTAGVAVTSVDGPFLINAQNTASSINLVTNDVAQDLSINLLGATNSSIILNSSGTGSDAIKFNTTAGSIDVNSSSAVTIDSAAASNFTVTGAFDLALGSTDGSVIVSAGEAVADAVVVSAPAGGIAMSSGTLGTAIDTTGGVSIDASTASNFTLTGTDALTVNNVGGQLILESSKATADALRIYASNGAGGIDIDSGTGGISASSQGTVSVSAIGAASNFSLLSSGDAQDLTIALTGSSDSSVAITSSGTGVDAIKLFTSAGGVDLSSFGGITIDSLDVSNGIKIATVSSGPVVIGTANSTTTIAGDLVVSGTNTIINTQTLTVEDNVIAINSGAGELGADGGIIIRRYQTANDDGSGDVVQDTGAGAIAGVFQAGSAIPGTLVLAADSSSVDGFYIGFWIKFTVAAVVYTRRIKSYTGATQTATIYTTGEADGLDLSEAPSAAGTYTLYNSGYIATFYREADDRWNIAYTSLAPRPIDDSGTSMFSVQRYSAMDVGSVTIQANEVAADSLLNVNVINETTPDSGVTVEGVLIKDGLVNGSLPDATEVVSLLDNSTAAVDILNSGTAGSYMILVTAVQGGDPLSTQDNGAHATFVASSSGIGGGVTRLSASLGSDGQRIDITWGTGQKIKLRHAPAFIGGSGASVMYRVKLISVV
jgi:hypothetical protein